jgi:hypothetical protein
VTQTRFAIVFIGRDGSSFLKGLLNSHPDARCDGEILAYPYDPPAHGSVEQFLTAHLHADEHRVIGFKLAYTHSAKYPETWDIFRRHGYRLIHLRRQNRVDQFISMMLAETNNQWLSDQGGYRITKFRAELWRADNCFQRWSEMEAEQCQAMRAFAVLGLTYEDLVKPAAGVLPVLEFLGLTDVPLQSPFTKQRCGSQSDAIENYTELKSHFAGTQWENHFLD